jgi:hypothetical protein
VCQAPQLLELRQLKAGDMHALRQQQHLQLARYQLQHVSQGVAKHAPSELKVGEA